LSKRTKLKYAVDSSGMRIKHPPDPDPERAACHVEGNILHEPSTDLNTAETGFLGAFHARLCSALCGALEKKTIKLFSPKFQWRPTAWLGRPPTALELQLDGRGIVVVDYKLLTGQRPCCPMCGKNDKVESKGWPDNAKSIKGDGDTHTWYLAGRRWKCLNVTEHKAPVTQATQQESKDQGSDDAIAEAQQAEEVRYIGDKKIVTFQDSAPAVFMQLPQHIRSSLGITQTRQSGLKSSSLQLSISLSKTPASQKSIADAATDQILAGHYNRMEAHYGGMVNRPNPLLKCTPSSCQQLPSSTVPT